MNDMNEDLYVGENRENECGEINQELTKQARTHEINQESTKSIKNQDSRN